MPKSIRPGDVLADRYHLVDLLVESGDGRFWRAHDRVLDRHVALHVLAADDERSAGLLEAARRSATVQDRRLLRVLDADRTEGLCYVVNEWGSGSSLDIMLSAEGPMAPRRAAWLVSEVAASVAVGHAAGVAHGRLVPENVLVDRSGSVRLIGYCVDAALHGLSPDRLVADVTDLGALLYCALTGRWSGASPSDIPRAPDEHGRVLRPRQVRAGIPRPLDQLCDQLVNPYAAQEGRAGPELTPRGIADFLREFVGDPAGLAAAEARQQSRRPEQRGQDHTLGIPLLPAAATMSLRAVGSDAGPGHGAGHGAGPTTMPDTAERDTADPDAAEPDTETRPASQSETPPEAPTEVQPAAGADDRAEPRAGAVDLPTQAGMPVFDDERDEVSWLRARSTPPPPPPPFEDLPERPLFAPEPAEGQPARKTRPNATASGSGNDFWPWDTSNGTGSGVIPVTEEDEEDGRVPGRRWMRLALVLGLSLVLLVAVVVTFNLGRGRTPLGAVPEEHRSSPSVTAKASPTPITGLTATDLDPQGNPPEEYPELAGLSVDGDPGTAWRTSTYAQNFGPAGLKTGVGLVVDLGSVHAVRSVDLTFIGAPTSASLYLSGQQPSSVGEMDPVGKVQAAQPHTRVALDEGAKGRYLTIWLTSLPAVDGGYRGEVAEVAVRG